MSLTFPLSESTEIQINFLLKVFASTDANARLEKPKAGVANFTYIFTCSTSKAVVHIYNNNTEVLDHSIEKENIRMIGFSKILTEFTNGYVLNYFEGEPLTIDNVKEEKISTLIAKKLANFHSVSSPKNHNDVFEFLNSYLTLLHSKALEEKAQNLRRLLESELELDGFVLNHGDLNVTNIILQTDSFGNSSDVQFIDYEYCRYTWPLYDVASHFLKMTGFQVDLRRFPSTEMQARFIATYYTERNRISGRIQTETPFNNARVADALRKIPLLVKLSNLVIACYCFVNAKRPMSNFPYQKYADARLRCIDYDLPLPSEHEMMQKPLLSD